MSKVGFWEKLKSFEYPAQPTLDEGEELIEEFRGVRARVTLTDERIIVSRIGHTSIPYGDVVDLDGGWVAGPTYPNWRDNASITGGVFLKLFDGSEEWVHVPEAERVADLIRARATNLWTSNKRESIWGWMKRLQSERGQAE